MALNKLMHPRNPYCNRRPDFKSLSQKYEKFRQHAVHDSRGRVHLDFKQPECLRALSWALLMDDFDLDVEMPLDRLVPTVPLRINYILWLEDLLELKQGPSVTGIDIGGGASCVYALLAAKKNNWEMLVSEIDTMNAEYAKLNVKKNGLNEKITVECVPEESTLCDLLKDRTSTYDFCMCNPPFFGSNMEAWGLTSSRTDKRPQPKSVSTASPAESVVPGGEVQFVRKIIEDSLVLTNKIRIYTTMLGKKSSLMVLKQMLGASGITNIGVTEFCQGRTMRWGLGWSFDPNVKFPKAVSKLKKEEKRPPISLQLSHQVAALAEVGQTLSALGDLLQSHLKSLRMSFNEIGSGNNSTAWMVTATENTWSHQRRKRRAEKVHGDDSPPKAPCEAPPSHTPPPTSQIQRSLEGEVTCHVTEQGADDGGGHETEVTKSEDISAGESSTEACASKDGKVKTGDEINVGRSPEKNCSGSHPNPRNGRNGPIPVMDCDGGKDGRAAQSIAPSSATAGTDAVDVSPRDDGGKSSDNDEHILRFKLCAIEMADMKSGSGGLSVELHSLDGTSKELLHQVACYFRNNLK